MSLGEAGSMLTTLQRFSCISTQRNEGGSTSDNRETRSKSAERRTSGAHMANKGSSASWEHRNEARLDVMVKTSEVGGKDTDHPEEGG